MMTNCDELVVVQAKKGEVENVREALEKALQDQKDAFGFYPVMNNTERLDAAKVVTQGDYAALLIVGISPKTRTQPSTLPTTFRSPKKHFITRLNKPVPRLPTGQTAGSDGENLFRLDIKRISDMKGKCLYA